MDLSEGEDLTHSQSLFDNDENDIDEETMYVAAMFQ